MWLKSKKNELLKTACKNPYQLKQIIKCHFQWCSLLKKPTIISKRQSQHFYNNWMMEQSHCYFRNQKTFKCWRKIGIVSNNFISVILTCQSFKQPIQCCSSCKSYMNLTPLRVGTIFDISQNILWHAPSYEYLILTKRAIKMQCGWACWSPRNNRWNN